MRRQRGKSALWPFGLQADISRNREPAAEDMFVA